VLLTVIPYSFPAQRRPEIVSRSYGMPPGTEPVDPIYRGVYIVVL